MQRLAIAFALASAVARPALAFSVQIHSVLANRLAANLYANGNEKLKLEFRDAAIAVDKNDGEAIVKNMRAWRAGVLGPDNTIFPAMTDPSHAISTEPFQQCNELYKLATLPGATQAERAYALGCFFHGVTDNVAHHLVNFFSGETFTLAPTSHGLESNFSNVIRHIVFEGLIEAGIKKANPELFQSAYFTQFIPNQFFTRIYLDYDSNVWWAHEFTVSAMAQKEAWGLSEDCQGTYACGTAARGLRYLEFLAGMSTHGLASYPFLLPDMVLEGYRAFSGVPDYFENIKEASMSDRDLAPIKPGKDGNYGTLDDEPNCRLWCPIKYAKYFLAVFLTSDSGNGMSHIERLTDRKMQAIDRIPAAYEQMVVNLSSKIAQEGLIGMGPSGLSEAMKPFTDAVMATVTLTYDDVSYLFPSWLRTVIENVSTVRKAVAAVFDAFKSVLEWVLKPLKDYVHKKIHEYIDPILADLRNQYDPIKREYETKLEELTGDREWLNSGWKKTVFIGNALNNAYATLKARSRVLSRIKNSDGSYTVIGPRTFDASYQIEASKTYACDALRSVYFPYGTKVSDMLGKFDAEGNLIKPKKEVDAPVECFDGNRRAFASVPSEENCQLVSLAKLQEGSSPRGSWTAGFPVSLRPAAERGVCAASADDPNPNAGDSLIEEAGCGCTAAGGLAGPGLVLALGMGLSVLRRRRARR